MRNLGLKRVILYLISLMYYYSVRLVDIVFGRVIVPYAIVPYYHSIPDVSRNNFIKHVEYYINNTLPLELNDLAMTRTDKPYIALTFDDAYRTVLDNAYPILCESGIPAILFSTCYTQGEHAPWNDSVEYENKLMNSKELSKVLENDIFVLGSHTKTHRSLTQTTRQEASDEIINSKLFLEKFYRLPVKFLSFPHGEYSLEHLELAKSAGYQHVFSSDPVKIYDFKNSFLLGRVNVEANDTICELNLKFKGGYAWRVPYGKFKQSLRTFEKPKEAL